MHFVPISRFVLRGLAAGIAAVLLAVLAPPALADGVVGRVAGESRIATAVAAAEAGWDTAEHVMLATSQDYPDAVAAAALAADRDAPVLLTDPDRLPPEVARALTRLETARVTVLGGPRAVAGDVVRDLRDRGLTVDRIAGDDRFATAATIAGEVVETTGGRTVALALGMARDRDAWPDALAAASLAGLATPVPTLLSSSDGLPRATREALDDLDIERVLVLGGRTAVPDRVVDALEDRGLAVTRIHGITRYETAVNVAKTVISRASASAKTEDEVVATDAAVFVSGEDFVDALAGGALAAHRSVPLMLVPAGLLSDGVDGYLRHEDTPIDSGVLVGGTAAVSDHVQAELRAAMTGEPRPAPPPPPCPPNSSPDCAYTYEHAIATWERLAQCESGGNWAINTGNGYYGGVQFALSSWQSVGGRGYPHQNSKWEQIHRAELLHDRQGWGAWPACSRKLGLR